MSDCNILFFGAVGDGITKNTKAIQTAIDTCANAGGGRVTVPPGVFLSGTIYLRSGVELHLSSTKSILRASPDFEDYCKLEDFPQNRISIPEKMNGGHFIVAIETDGTSITGLGSIEGNGHSFFLEDKLEFTWRDTYCFWPKGFTIVKNEEKQRPGQMVMFAECTNLLIKDVTFKDSPYWTLFIYGCENVIIHSIKIFNPPTFLNSDGIDIDLSRNVTVSDCIIETGDDALTLRGDPRSLKNKDRITENVTVSNCVLCSGGANAIRVGVGDGEVRNCVLSNLVFHDSVGGIHIQSKYSNTYKGEGTTISNILFQNITARNVTVPFMLNSGFKASASIRNITLADCLFELKHTSGVVGNGFAKVENITLRNVDFAVTGRTPGIDNHDVDCTEYGTHSPSLDCILFFAHADVRLDNVRLHFPTPPDKNWKYGYVKGPMASLDISSDCKLDL